MRLNYKAVGALKPGDLIFSRTGSEVYQVLGVKLSQGRFRVVTRFLDEEPETVPDVIKAYNSGIFLSFDVDARKDIESQALKVGDVFQANPFDTCGYQARFIGTGRKDLLISCNCFGGKSKNLRIELDSVVTLVSLLTEAPKTLRQVKAIEVGQEIHIIAPQFGMGKKRGRVVSKRGTELYWIGLEAEDGTKECVLPGELYVEILSQACDALTSTDLPGHLHTEMWF